MYAFILFKFVCKYVFVYYWYNFCLVIDILLSAQQQSNGIFQENKSMARPGPPINLATFLHLTNLEYSVQFS